MMRSASLVILLLSAPFSQIFGERLSPYGLAKPVLIVSGELPKDFQNKDGATILNVLKDEPPAGFQFLRHLDEQPRLGAVGLHVPAGAFVQIKQRMVSNLGKGVATLKL